jgi:alkylhydroperoxidase/carboxymuconolactone decarboxylase family protein YurZ
MRSTASPASVSSAFQVFADEAKDYAQAWADATEALGRACVLEGATRHLAYLAVLAALGLESGVPFHVMLAKSAGASRAEIISAVLLGLQPAGHRVTACLPIALAAYDRETGLHEGESAQ